MPPRLSRRATFGAPLALAACTHGGGLAGACPSPPVAQAAMVPSGPSLLVPVRLNDLDVAMVLDTGSVANLITRDAAQRLGLTPAGQYKAAIGGLATTEEVAVVKLDRLALGGLEQRDVVMPVGAFRTQAAGPLPVIGLLGMANLSKYDLQLDFPARMLRLHPHADCAEPEPDWGGGVTQLALDTVYRGKKPRPVRKKSESEDRVAEPEITAVQRLVFEATVNGHPFAAMLDTGTARSVLSFDAVALSGMATDGTPGRVADALGGSADIVRLPGSSVRVGTLSWTDVPLALTRERLDDGVDMLFGLDLLRNLRLWAMLRAHKLFVQRA